jgi:hypothetical protein
MNTGFVEEARKLGHYEDLNMGSRILLKWILEKEDGVI